MATNQLTPYEVRPVVDKDFIVGLTRTNPIVYSAIRLCSQGVITWEQALMLIVAKLDRQNSNLTKEVNAITNGQSTNTDDLVKERFVTLRSERRSGSFSM